jgi:hypothetical protein
VSVQVDDGVDVRDARVTGDDLIAIGDPVARQGTAHYDVLP